jgi:hypothetical protein
MIFDTDSLLSKQCRITHQVLSISNSVHENFIYITRLSKIYNILRNLDSPEN